MLITGKYERDDNFTTIYSNNTVYTIARGTGDWGSLKVGKSACVGGVLAQERYNELESQCVKEGTFELKLN